MRDEQMMNQSLSIVIKLYQSFLQGLPDLFEGIDTFKASAYYQDVLRRDIKQTDECLCIAAEDEAVRLVEIKLQEKGIPWEKRKASDLQGVVKANGMFVFLCRGIDEQRVREAMREVQLEFERSHRPEPEMDAEKEQDEAELERERESERTTSDEEMPEKESETEHTDTSQENDDSDDLEAEEASKKQKKKKTTSTYLKQERPAYNHDLHRQETYTTSERAPVYQEPQHSKSPEPSYHHPEESYQRERESHSYTERSHSSEQHRDPRPESVQREGLAGYNRYRETDFSHRSAKNESSESEHSYASTYKSDIHKEEKAKHDGQFVSEKFQREPERRKEESTPASQTTSRDSEAYVKKEHITAKKPVLESTREIARTSTGEATRETTGSNAVERPQHIDPSTSANQPHSYIEKRTEPLKQESTRMGGFQSIGNERTIAETGRQASRPITSTEQSSQSTTKTQHSMAKTAGEQSGTIQILGSGHDIQESTGVPSTTTRGGFFNESARHKAAEAVRQATRKVENNVGGYQPTHSPKDVVNPEHIVKALRGQQNAESGKISEKKIVVTTISRNSFESTANSSMQDQSSEKSAPDASIGEQSTVHQSTKQKEASTSQWDTRHSTLQSGYTPKIDQHVVSMNNDWERQILMSRRFYHMRDILSPDHFKTVFRASRRIAMQSVLSRETEAGQVAMNAIDYASPLAIAMQRKLLANGAMQIARTTQCSTTLLASFYATQKGITLQQANVALANMTMLDISMVCAGKGRLSLADMETLKNAGDLFSLGEGRSLMSAIARLDNNTFLAWVQNAPISEDLKKALMGIPVKDLTPAKLQSLLKQFSGTNDIQMLKTLYASKINARYGLPKGSGFHTVLKGWLTRLLKSSMKDSDAARALGQILGVSQQTYMAYRAGMRLLLTILNKIPFKNKEQLVSEVAFKIMADPMKAARVKAAESVKTAGMKAGSKLLGKHGTKLMQKRSVQHATSALKFIAHPMQSIGAKLSSKFGETAVWKAMQALSGKITAFAAKAAFVLGWAAVILLVIILIVSLISNLSEEAKKDQTHMKPYNFSQDTEIVQEIITELTQKNEAFMADINDAANHRGAYSTTSGLTTNENVSFYESYNIVFRDSYGNELEPTHVDLNNTKAILSMASKFISYPLQKPADAASLAEKKAYEDIKQHFKDYCYFLWAATHQIAIEEYHPGHSEGVDGAIDNSGLETTLDKGLCDKDGTTKWFKADFTQDIISRSNGDWVCDSCDEVPNTGMGDELDDLCTHGKDDNSHGGWKMTGAEPRYVFNCQTDHRHIDCDHDPENYSCSMGTCEDAGNAAPISHGHWEYEWVYNCGGHMGSVVYVTIGDLSRDPGFNAAKDVDYSAVGQYGDSISGDDILNDSGTLTYRGYAYTKSVDQSSTPFVYVYTLVEDDSTYEGSTEEEAMNKFQQHVDTLPPKETENAETNTE